MTNDGPDGPDPALGGLLARLARSMGPDGVQLGGENVRLEQEPESGLEVRITLLDDAGEVTSVASMLLPADTPAEGHPADIPFVRHAPLRVIQDRVRGVTLAMWLLGDGRAPEPRTALAAVVRGSREAGWRLVVDEATGAAVGAGPEEGAGTPGESGPIRLLRGDEVRRVEVRSGPTGPVVSLSQRRDVKEAG